MEENVVFTGNEASPAYISWEKRFRSMNLELLAYETGVHLGDGSLYVNRIVYAGDSREDKPFYSEIFPQVLEELYGLKPRFFFPKGENTILTTLYSSKIASFKAKELGLPVGNKLQIRNFPKELKDNYPHKILQGLADSDFGIYFRDQNGDGYHEYPRIEGSFNNPFFVSEIVEMLDALQIKCNVRKCLRREKFVEYRVWIEGKPRVNSWLQKVGFKNPKHLTKFELWKKFGYCQPHINYLERMALLR